MRDVELYQQLLDVVSPWTVNRVELSVEGERVDVWVEHAPEVRWPCPECATRSSSTSGYPRKTRMNRFLIVLWKAARG
jgi:hypothetical protein